MGKYANHSEKMSAALSLVCSMTEPSVYLFDREVTMRF